MLAAAARRLNRVQHWRALSAAPLLGDPSGAIAFVDVAVHPEMAGAFVSLSAANAAQSVLEPTNARFDLLREAAGAPAATAGDPDPARFVLVEAYGESAGAAAHKDTAHYNEWRGAVADMMAQPRAARKYRTLFPATAAGLRTDGGGASSSSSSSSPSSLAVAAEALDITHVDVQVVPGSEEAFAAASLANAACSVREAANLRFDVLQREDDPARFLLVEVYADAAGAAAHKQSAHYLAWREAVASMMARPRRATAYKDAAAGAGGSEWGGTERAGAAACASFVSPRVLRMHDGRPHPAVGFGTYKVGGAPASASAGFEAAGDVDAADVVEQAAAVGYRFFDCGAFYENEAAVGCGLRRLLPGGGGKGGAAVASREALFVVGKVWNDAIAAGAAAVRAQVERSLTDLGVGYLDLVLVHWPVPGKHVEAFGELQRLRAEGLVRGVGLSNYTIEDYEELRRAAPEEPSGDGAGGAGSAGGAGGAVGWGAWAPPLVNQIEVSPFLHRPQTLRFFAEQGVLVQAYRPLGTGDAARLGHPVVAAAAAAHGRSAAQVLGRWCVQKGMVYLPKSVRPARMRENAAVFDFALTESEMAALDALTTPEALEEFRALYSRCALRDTPLADTWELRHDITVG